jgi:hypothetical protein
LNSCTSAASLLFPQQSQSVLIKLLAVALTDD